MRKQRGVIATRARWTGGDIPNPTEASPGTHAEAVEIVFDPGRTSFRGLPFAQGRASTRENGIKGRVLADFSGFRASLVTTLRRPRRAHGNGERAFG